MLQNKNNLPPTETEPKRPRRRDTSHSSSTGVSAADDAALALAKLSVVAGLEKKALEPVLLDVREQSTYTDFIVLLSGRSDRHVQAVSDAVIETLVKHGHRPIGMEGHQQGHWTLIDFGELVVHVFHHPVREFYDLEGLWCDARRIPLEVPPEARAEPTMY